VAIRESRPIFKKPRQRRAAGLGPWMLLVLLALVVAAGLYIYDKRSTEQIDALQKEVAQLRAAVTGAAAARKAMQGVADKQVALTGGQVTALWSAIKKLQDRAAAIEARLKEQATKDTEASAANNARAAAMLKDIAAIRADMAALLKRLSALEKRVPKTEP
jgi:polyhydroxyalkanoate synthesis regulator phasin